MNPALVVDLSHTGPDSFVAEDASDPRFRIEASVRTDGGERVLSFLVVAELPDGTRGQLRGVEFFTAMLDHFGDAAVDVIEAQWEAVNPHWATNLTAFNRLTGSTRLTEAEAATRVPTGIYATRRGFATVSVVAAAPPGARGKYTAVVVRFRK